MKSYIFSACSDGQIVVLDLNKPGKEKLIKEISNFGGNMKLNVVKYYREQNQLITGDENGRIIIWNLKIGKSIFSFFDTVRNCFISIIRSFSEVNIFIIGG